MRDKEKLLSFKSKLKFIFAHFALKEGGDNPNVFQICTLNETASVIKKRQQIDRGLRISVNQDGERVHGFEVNTLTVIANESYEDFISQVDLPEELKSYAGQIVASLKKVNLNIKNAGDQKPVDLNKVV
jgi:type III restriction enzyme